MWQLRLIIILIGLVFIALVYLLSRQRKSRRTAPKRDEPSLTGMDAVQVQAGAAGPVEMRSPPKPDPVIASVTAVPSRPPAKPLRQLIVVLHVTGRSAAELPGEKALAALQANGLQYGRMHVFHRLAKPGGEMSVFSVANMVEPGELRPEVLAQQKITGLTLFLVLPGPMDAVAACADMLATARALATQLQGEVQNENHTPFTIEDAQRIRQRVLEFQTAI